MKDLLIISAGWLHLTSVVVWVGGIIFILFVAMPSSKQALGPDAGKLMGEVSKRFTPLANYSILLLVITGIVLTFLKGYFSGTLFFEGYYSLTLSLKYILAFGMIAIHFYRGMILAPSIGRAESPLKKTSLQKISLSLVKINLALGIIILLLAAIGLSV